jgi:hypothetical protein
MTDSELLLQRFVDQELSADECMRFAVQIARDEALRSLLIELQQLALDASRIPRPAVPDGFVGRVIERSAPARSLPHRVVRLLWAPRTLHWNLVSATALACLVVAAAWGGVTVGRLERVAQRVAVSESQQAGAPAAKNAAQAVLVRLIVVQPSARSVHVAGDFNGWNPARTPLEPNEGGAWTVMLPLQPGRYAYQFVVDGDRWIADPFAAEQNDDGFGSRNAVLDVPTLDPTRASL